MAIETPQGNGTGTGCRKQQKQHICQALGCTCDLSGTKLYYQRKHLCEVHVQAECVRLHNTKQLFRFCFQCGKLEDLQSFDGNKRTCRARLQKRRNSAHSQKQKASLKPATPSSRLSSLSSISDAAAAAAKAGPRTERDTLPGNACSWDLQVGPVGGAAAAQEPAAAVPGCSAHQVAHQQQWQQQPVEVAGSSGSSGSPTTGPWAPYAAAASPMASGTQGTGSGSSLLTGTQQLAPSSTATPTSSICWGPAAAGAAAAAAGIKPLPPLEDLMPCLDDTASLQIMLESELTAAALGAAIVTSSHQQARDVESRRISQHLAAVLVQDSGLFGEPGAACTAGVLGLDSSLWGAAAGHDAVLSPRSGPAPAVPVQPGQRPGSNVDGWGCVGNSGAFPTAAPAAGPVWGYQAMCLGLQAPLMSYGFAAPACSSTAGPLGSMGVAPAQPPAGPGMHCSPGVFAAGCGGQLHPAAAAAAPVKVEPGLPITNTLLGAAGAVRRDGKTERLHQLQQEMCHLHHCVESLRCQLGL